MNRIVICALNYYPEFLGAGRYTTELAEEFVKEGYRVRVITSPPYYPEWKIQKPYVGYKYKKEVINKVEIIRCPIWVPQNPGEVFRLFHLFSFALTSLPIILAQRSWRPSVFLLIAPTILNAPIVWLAAKISGAKSWIHIQDFEIDVSQKMKMKGMIWLGKMLAWFEKRALMSFDYCSTISNQMQKKLWEKGVPRKRTGQFPNWVDLDSSSDIKCSQSLADFSGLSENSFIVMYSGTLNRKHDIRTLILAAKELEDHANIKFIICGTGSEEEKLKKISSGSENILWMKPVEKETLPQFLASANVHVLPQNAAAEDLVLPSKLTGMLASQRPVVATANINTEISRLVSQCGIVVAPQDVIGLSQAILQLSMDQKLCKRFGDEAGKLARVHFDKNQIISSFVSKLSEFS